MGIILHKFNIMIVLLMLLTVKIRLFDIQTVRFHSFFVVAVTEKRISPSQSEKKTEMRREEKDDEKDNNNS